MRCFESPRGTVRSGLPRQHGRKIVPGGHWSPSCSSPWWTSTLNIQDVLCNNARRRGPWPGRACRFLRSGKAALRRIFNPPGIEAVLHHSITAHVALRRTGHRGSSLRGILGPCRSAASTGSCPCSSLARAASQQFERAGRTSPRNDGDARGLVVGLLTGAQPGTVVAESRWWYAAISRCNLLRLVQYGLLCWYRIPRLGQRVLSVSGWAYRRAGDAARARTSSLNSFSGRSGSTRSRILEMLLKVLGHGVTRTIQPISGALFRTAARDPLAAHFELVRERVPFDARESSSTTDPADDAPSTSGGYRRRGFGSGSRSAPAEGAFRLVVDEVSRWFRIAGQLRHRMQGVGMRLGEDLSLDATARSRTSSRACVLEVLGRNNAEARSDGPVQASSGCLRTRAPRWPCCLNLVEQVSRLRPAVPCAR